MSMNVQMDELGARESFETDSGPHDYYRLGRLEDLGLGRLDRLPFSLRILLESLLGVKIVLAESFERTHRSNLVGMGILPLQFKPGQSACSLGLRGDEILTVQEPDRKTRPRADLTVWGTKPEGSTFCFEVTLRLDSPVELAYYEQGGLLPAVLRRLLGTQKSP